MMSNLAELIPGAAHWPRFVTNRSEQFEARVSLLRIESSQSVWLSGMCGSVLPVAVAHGEGCAEFVSPQQAQHLVQSAQISARYCDGSGQATQLYPLNPNGSPDAIASVSSGDGRVTIMMPHPERVFRSVTNSWQDPAWGDDGPWMRLFRNARVSFD